MISTMSKICKSVSVVLCAMASLFTHGAHAQSNSNPATSCQTGGVTPGPIACWPMNDSSGSAILQEVIGGNNAGPAKSPVGASQAPQPIAGQFGGAIDFVKFTGTGLTGAVVGNLSGPLVFIGQGDFSIVTWIKFPPTSASAPPTGPGGRHYILNKYDAPQKKGYALYVIRPSGSNSSYLEFLWGDGGGTSPQTLRSNTPITPNQWHLVAVTFARNVGSNSLVVTLYVDGAPKGTYTSTSTATWGSLVNNLSIMIGYQPSSVDEPIALDELQIYNRALTANEISQIYNAGSGTQPSCLQPPSGMVAWYWMDGNAIDTAALGGFNNPSATNAISFVAGKHGQGVTFGSGGYIDIPHSSAMALQRFTIDAWVKPNGPGPNNDFWGSVIVQKGLPIPTGHTDQSVSLWWSAQQEKFIFGFGNSSTERIVSTSTFPAGQWYHVAATYDGTTFKLYVNGVLEGTMALTKTIVYDASIPWTIGSTAAPFRNLGAPRTFNGVIDEVEFFNRALSQGEIQAIYKRGKCKGKVFNPKPSPTN